MPSIDTTASTPSWESARQALPKVIRALEADCRPQSLERGRGYKEEGRTRLLELQENEARGEVLGTDDSADEVSLAWTEDSVRSSCSCPAWGEWDDHCKHVVAFAYALAEAANVNVGERAAPSRAPEASLLETLEPAAAPTAEIPPSLRAWTGVPAEAWAFSYDVQLEYDVAVGIGRVDKPRGGREGWLNVNRYLSTAVLDPADRRVFAALAPFPRDVEGRYRVPAPVAGVVFEALRGRPVTSGGKRIGFAQWPAHLAGELAQRENHRTLALKLRLADGATVPLPQVKLLSAVPAYVLVGTDLHRLESAAPLEQLEKWLAQPTFEFRREDTGGIDFALAALRRYGAVLDAGAEVAAVPPRFALTLDGNAESVRALLAVRYGPVELPLSMAGATTHVTNDGRLIRRDVEAESDAVAVLEKAGLLRAGDNTFSARGDRAVEFWTRGAEHLPSDWELFGPRPQKVVKVRQLRPNLGLKQAPTGWFSLELAFASDDQSIELSKLRPLLMSGRRYVQLADGSMGELPRELSQQLKSVLDETGAEPDGNSLALAPYEAGAVERLLELVPEALVAPETRRFLAALRDFHGIDEAELPVGLKAELRPYQRRGYDWLLFLHRFGLSGVLADDMGLGKTLQALTLLLKVKKDEGRKPSLIIAPTSVLPNWQREAERFTPNIKTVVYEGADRDEKRASFKGADLVLTSYAILRRDGEQLAKTEFRYVILDEAQHIKNPGSLGARAARGLRSERRLALTGTPLENRLGELWSLFDFLMPGFLGTEGQFRNRYARPIEIDGDAGVRERLKRRVHPFMLRRLKDEVAKDLPPRTDSVLPVELSAGQQAIYREMLETARNRVQSIIDAVGFKKARISILAELLRLRQVCCDPRLLKLPPGTRLPPSAKLEAFGELVKDLVGEGHRALIFSQFTEMLGHLTQWADEEGLKYEYLDGKTTDRQERIDRFQSPDGPPLFFISLKAGGTGLNLTAADYVIHFDPWWNPAVEQQATDRAHRIGQTKPVFSYKLIARGTVEEKILQMQQRKKSLAENVLSSDDEEVGKLLTEKDVQELFS